MAIGVDPWGMLDGRVGLGRCEKIVPSHTELPIFQIALRQKTATPLQGQWVPYRRGPGLFLPEREAVRFFGFAIIPRASQCLPWKTHILKTHIFMLRECAAAAP